MYRNIFPYFAIINLKWIESSKKNRQNNISINFQKQRERERKNDAPQSACLFLKRVLYFCIFFFLQFAYQWKQKKRSGVNKQERSIVLQITVYPPTNSIHDEVLKCKVHRTKAAFEFYTPHCTLNTNSSQRKRKRVKTKSHNVNTALYLCLVRIFQ